MSLPNELHPLQLGAGSASGYQIEQSLRFNSADSAYLYRTPSSAGNQRTWTWSVWLKRGSLGTEQNLFTPQYGGDGSNENQLQFLADDTFRIYDSGGSWLLFDTTQVFRDPSAWFHLVIAVDTTQATSTDRFKLYINGVQVTVFDQSLYPVQDRQLGWNSAVRHDIGRYAQGASKYFNGYMAEFHMVDGTALDHEDFGEFDESGVWRPIEVSGLTYGTTGFYLKFDSSAANGIGHDHSGNGNHFTASGFSTSGTGTDVMSDTPTTNYATINPLETFNGRFSNAPTNGNLEISIPSDSTLKRNYAGMHASIVVPTTGKYYFEFEASQQYTRFVAVDVEYSYSVSTGDNYALTNKKSVIFSVSDGNYYYDGANNSTASGHGGNSAPSGDIYGVAIDLGNGTLQVDLNGTAGTQLDISDWAGESARVAAFVSASTSSGTIKYNFGAQGFAHTPPTGFKALNTANLPAPDIADGSEYFNTVTYTGNTSTQSITGVGFQPDFVWAKDRTNANSHALFNVISGAGTRLSTNLTAAEITDNTTLTSFDADGFSLGSDGGGIINRSARNYVAWNWLAGGSGSSNTDGTITSTVSASPSSGFSIVTYSGTGSAATVGHGLGVVPSFYVVKPRSEANNWPCYHKSLTSADYYIHLNLTLGEQAASVVWNGTAPSSTVFNIGTNTNVNQSGATFVAYCFAEVEGYSKFGSYSGGDGVFVYLGFKPSLLILKGTVGTRNWIILDSKRSTYNVVDDIIHPNVNVAESASGSSSVDFVSNGFVTRGGNISGSGDLTIFAAFAENPFGGSGVSPATAR